MENWLKFLSAEVISQILETAFQWFVVVDRNARIIYINDEYCHFLEVSREEAIGKHVADVIENSEMHLIMERGTAEIAAPHYIKGTYMLANRVPIVLDGEIIGAFGSVIFRDMNDWKKLSSHVRKTMDQIETNINQYRESFYNLADIKGNSQTIRKIKETITTIAPTKLPVLIEGEMGTGKEMFAQSIHRLSNRAENYFVKINCSTIPKELLEEEIFGKWEANQGVKKGRIQRADGGTLYIQEINELPITLQAKLLKALQDQKVQPHGTDEEISVDVRFLLSSNVSLAEMVKIKLFREDLFYKIQAITLQIPPLRERIEDLPELIQTFLSQYSVEAGRRGIKIERKAWWVLQQYDWPGNVRELQNVLQAIIHLAEGDQITLDVLPLHIRRQTSTTFSRSNSTLEEMLLQVEGQILQEHLDNVKDKMKIAKKLGISRSTLYEKIKKHNL